MTSQYGIQAARRADNTCMPSSRRSSKRPYGSHVPLDLDRATGGLRLESDEQGQWSVRTITGSDKSYICPACQQTISPATAHVVAWFHDGIGGESAGLDNRRHWHKSCWQRRGRLR